MNMNKKNKKNKINKIIIILTLNNLMKMKNNIYFKQIITKQWNILFINI